MPIVKALRINLQKTEPEIQDWDDYYNDFSVVFTINILFSSVFAGIVTIFVDIYTHLEAF